MKRNLLMMTCLVAALNAQAQTLPIYGAGIRMGQQTTAPGNEKGKTVTFTLNERKDTPWNQQCVKGKEVKEVNAEPAKQGPRADKPYFAVRMALPVPPAYTETELAQAVGIDWGVYHHHHSPGFEVLPNGDALAVYFSSPRGVTETPF